MKNRSKNIYLKKLKTTADPSGSDFNGRAPGRARKGPAATKAPRPLRHFRIICISLASGAFLLLFFFLNKTIAWPLNRRPLERALSSGPFIGKKKKFYFHFAWRSRTARRPRLRSSSSRSGDKARDTHRDETRTQTTRTDITLVTIKTKPAEW